MTSPSQGRVNVLIEVFDIDSATSRQRIDIMSFNVEFEAASPNAASARPMMQQLTGLRIVFPTE